MMALARLEQLEATRMESSMGTATKGASKPAYNSWGSDPGQVGLYFDGLRTCGSSEYIFPINIKAVD